jgi:cell division transport system permease protein
MAKQPKVRTSKFFNSNFTTTISIAMVLFLVGIITTLTLVAKQTSDYVKSNISFTVVLEDSIANPDLQVLQTRLKTAPYVKSTKFISKERAMSELSDELGEMPEDVIGYNPLLASIEVNASAEYANASSMDNIKKELSAYDGVHEVIYQENMMEDVNKNINLISLFLAGVALLMLIVSIGLINNTIRLQLYSKRFTINTMRLVGATAWFIRKPFLGRSLLNGLIAALLSSALLEGLLYYLQYYYGFPLFNLVAPMNIAITVGVIFILGIVISLFSSMFAVGKYLRIKTSDLYYI